MLEIRPLYDAVYEHARREYPREACGLLVRPFDGGMLSYRPCRNLAPEGAAMDRFVLDPRDVMAAEADGDIQAVVHSHPDGSAHPSVSDRRECHRSGVVWYVLAYPDGAIKRIDPTPLPLVGREFAHGSVDCYSLVQDHFAQRLQIALPDFERTDGWWHRGEQLYTRNFAAAGFEFVGHPSHEQPREHDVVLMQIKADEPNHAAVYTGDGTILHHLWGRLSGHDVWGGYWQRHATHVLRHGSLL